MPSRVPMQHAKAPRKLHSFMACVEGTRRPTCYGEGCFRALLTASHAPTNGTQNQHLRIRRVLEGIKNLLQRDNLPSLPVDGLPDDAIRLRRAKCSAELTACPPMGHAMPPLRPVLPSHPLAKLLHNLIFPDDMWVHLLVAHRPLGPSWL